MIVLGQSDRESKGQDMVRCSLINPESVTALFLLWRPEEKEREEEKEMDREAQFIINLVNISWVPGPGQGAGNINTMI